MLLRKNGDRSIRSERPVSRRSGSCVSVSRRKSLARSQTRPRRRPRPPHRGPRRGRNSLLRREKRTERWRSMSLSPPLHRPIRRASRLLRSQRVSPPIQGRRTPRSPWKRTRTTRSNTRSLTWFAFSSLPLIFHAGVSLFPSVNILRTEGLCRQLAKVVHCYLSPLH